MDRYNFHDLYVSLEVLHLKAICDSKMSSGSYSSRAGRVFKSLDSYKMPEEKKIKGFVKLDIFLSEVTIFLISVHICHTYIHIPSYPKQGLNRQSRPVLSVLKW